LANQNDDRRQSIRRSVDDCSQCDIWNFKFIQSDKEIAEHKAEVKGALEIVHQRISASVPWKVFLLIVMIYLGISVYNNLAIKNLSREMADRQARVETKIENIQKNIEEIKREVKSQ
jgi:hypothetical protein